STLFPYTTLFRSKIRVGMNARDLRKLHQHLVKEKTQPDTFAFALHAHQIHAVIPVPGTHERQTMLAETQAHHNGANAMVIQRARALRASWQVVIGIVFRIDWAALDKIDRFIQHAAVAGGDHIAAHRLRQPEEIVRAMRAHSPARWRMPPVLHVALGKLTRGTAQQMLAGEARFGMHECHRILQLIAKAEGAPRLVEAAPRPKAA